MNDKEIINHLRETSAVQHGHFVLTSGLHSDTYVQCARVLESPALTTKLAQEAVNRLPEDMEVDLVASPAVGGMLFGFAVAQALDVNFIFSERVNKTMTFRRSFAVQPGQKVLVVEDVVTTGGSVQEVISLIEEANAEVIGVVSLIDRGNSPVFDKPFYPLVSLEVSSWPADECKLCQEGTKFESLGSRTLA